MKRLLKSFGPLLPVLLTYPAWSTEIPTSRANSPQPLNVLWIVTDDHRADSIQAWNRAMTGKNDSELGYVLSPRADQLAAEGVLFTRAYCNSPACAPSRKSMHAGMYPHRVGQFGFERTHQSADVSRPSLPQLMARQGYGTARVGKGDHSAFTWDRKEFGKAEEVYESVIDRNRDFRWQGIGDWYNAKKRAKGKYLGTEILWHFPEPEGLVRLYYPEQGEPTKAVVNKASQIEQRLDLLRSYTRSLETLIIGGVSPQPTERTLDGLMVASFEDFLHHSDRPYTTPSDNQTPGPRSDKPMFAHFAFHFPHTPVLPSKEFRDKFAGHAYRVPDFNKDELNALPPQLVALYQKCNFADMKPDEKQQAMRDYYAFCAMGDSLVGRAVDAFKAYCQENERGYLIVYVIGDHGWHLGEQGIEAKFGPYDASNHCAVIVVSSDKKTWPAGKVCHDFVEYVDFAPTILRAARADLSAKPFAHLDGIPLDDTLRGRASRDYVLAELNHVIGPRAYLRSREFAFSMRVRKQNGKPGEKWGPTPGEDIRWALDAPRDEVELALFDLRSDPKEQRNVANDARYVKLADWFRNKLGRIVLGDGRVECDWTKENDYDVSKFAAGAHDRRLNMPKELVPKVDQDEQPKRATNYGKRQSSEVPIDYSSIRREALANLERLKTLTSRAKENGIDTARERVTIVTAERFLKFADWDVDHTQELRKACEAWYGIDPSPAEQYSRELPLKELRDVQIIIDAAIRELEIVLQRPSSRRPAAAVDHAKLKLNDGYFYYNGRPTFPSYVTWMPRDAELLDAYGNIGGIYIAPGFKKSRDKKARIAKEGVDFDETMGRVFFGHGQMPQWVKDEYAGIDEAKRRFTEYDIDNPGARVLWKALLADSVPELAGRNVSRGGYLLANEPHWYSASDEWDTGPVSDYTKAKFRTWLAKRHGTVNALNRLWGTQFASFSDVTIEIPIDQKLRGKPIWYDWCRFNMHRVAEFFAFLKAEVRKHDFDAMVHIKIMPEHLSNDTRSHGMDMESLVPLQDIIGCDVKMANASMPKKWETWPKRYAVKWHELAINFDFYRSLGPKKMIYDSEFHGLSTVHWRDPNLSPAYVRCVYWLAHLHGLGMNTTWYWGRNDDGSPLERAFKSFYASNLTQPRVMDAFGRTMKELNAFSPEVVALSTQPKHVRIFYSETEAINNKHYMAAVADTYEKLYHNGFPLGFATGRMLAEMSADKRSIAETIVVVVGAQRVTSAELSGLQSYLSSGGMMAIIGEDNLKADEYGRPHAALLQTGSGRLVRVPANDAKIVSVVSDQLKAKGVSSPVVLTETNEVGQPGCVWRFAPYDDGYLLLVINLGKSTAQIELADQTLSCRDLLTNTPSPSTFALAPFGLELLHVQK